MAIFRKQENASRDRLLDQGRDRAVPLDRVASGAAENPHSHESLLLKKELAQAYSHIELYKFQIKGLRQDIEQLKMDAVLSGLGGYPLAAVNPYGEQAEAEPPDLDPETVYNLAEYPGPGLDAFLDAVSLAHRSLEAAAALLPQPPPPPNLPGMQQNMLTALRTVARLDAAHSDLARQVQNRDIQIELLKDKIEIEQQKLLDGFVEKKIFEDLARQASALDSEKRALAETAARHAEAEQRIEQLLAERVEAEALAEDLRMQADAARQQADIMSERYQALKQEAGEREVSFTRKARALEMQVSHLGEELEKARILHQQRVSQIQERMRTQYREMQDLMREYDEAMAALREESGTLKRDNEALKQRNLRLADLVKAAHNRAEASSPAAVDDARRKLLRKFESAAGADTLMELRALFLGASAYQEAVRTFRQLLVDPKNQKFMPAICLLVGEFYKLAGRQEESSFYLANPLIRDDPFAREIIARIKQSKTARQAAPQENG